MLNLPCYKDFFKSSGISKFIWRFTSLKHIAHFLTWYIIFIQFLSSCFACVKATIKKRDEPDLSPLNKPTHRISMPAPITNTDYEKQKSLSKILALDYLHQKIFLPLTLYELY